MDFKPISIGKYIKIHLKNNPNENRKELKGRLESSLKSYLDGNKCHCGNDIWVIGSAFLGNGCFTCITGESMPINDYEISEALPKSKKKERIEQLKIDGGGYYDDEGHKINPNLISKPSLCLSCKKNSDPKEEVLCNLTRLDQIGEEEFICFAYSNQKEK